MQLTRDDKIYHTGKLGMKWGHHSAKLGKSISKTSIKMENNVKSKIRKITENEELSTEQQKSRNKKIIIAGVTATATALALYGSYKVYDMKVPRSIEVTKHVKELIGQQHIGNFNGFNQYRPIYNTKTVTETVVNTARKHFK